LRCRESMRLARLLFCAAAAALRPPRRLATDDQSKKLLLVHLPKAGGNTVIDYLVHLIGESQYPHLGKPGERHTKVRSARDASFVLLAEFERLTPDLRKKYFTLGLVREPCGYYLSLWSFGSGGRGKARRSAPRGTLGETKPFDNLADLDRFTEWLRAFRGYYGRLFNKTYGAIDAKAVDCWIRTEFLVDDFSRCMGEFRASGGVTKNASDVEPLQLNPSSHTACERYYNASRRELVVETERAFYETFLYRGCCDGNTTEPWATSILAPRQTRP